jgi:hypothetical protein
MDRQCFNWILEAALLANDGVTSNQMIFDNQIPKECVKVGIQLCNYLQNRECVLWEAVK